MKKIMWASLLIVFILGLALQATAVIPIPANKGNLSITVLDRPDSNTKKILPIPGALVSLTSPNRINPSDTPPLSGGYSGTTNAQGVVLLKAVLQGRYTVSVKKGGKVLFSKNNVEIKGWSNMRKVLTSKIILSPPSFKIEPPTGNQIM